MRPASIVNFERIVLLSILLTIVNLVVNWDRILAVLAHYRLGATFVVVAHVVIVGLFLLLLWLISRRRSSVAKWIYTVLTGIGLVVDLSGYPTLLGSGQMPAILMTVVQDGLAILSLWFLFRPDSSAWFRRADDSPAAMADPS